MSRKDDMCYVLHNDRTHTHKTEFFNKWSRSEYILNLEVLSNSHPQIRDEIIPHKYFLIKIYKNGNVDIKERTPHNYITDILIINDGIKFPKHIINIIDILLFGKPLKIGYQSHAVYWPYYYMVFDIISNYKKDQTTQELIADKELITKQKEELTTEKQLITKQIECITIQKEELSKQKEELDKLILYNQQQIQHYKSLEEKIISIEKDKEIILLEKQKIAICKEKMAKSKREFDDEKLKFEIEKDRINNFDIDKFLNLSSN